MRDRIDGDVNERNHSWIEDVSVIGWANRPDDLGEGETLKVWTVKRFSRVEFDNMDICTFEDLDSGVLHRKYDIGNRTAGFKTSQIQIEANGWGWCGHGCEYREEAGITFQAGVGAR